jgi:hypothetical protein
MSLTQHNATGFEELMALALAISLAVFNTLVLPFTDSEDLIPTLTTTLIQITPQETLQILDNFNLILLGESNSFMNLLSLYSSRMNNLVHVYNIDVSILDLDILRVMLCYPILRD